MTWKPVKIMGLDPESQRRAQENMDFWLGKGFQTRQAPPKPAPQPAAYAPPQWKPTYQGEEPPF